MLYWITPLINIFGYCLLFRVLLSWVPELQKNVLFDLLKKVTDPYLDLFRSRIPPLFGTVDISPMVAIFSLQLFERALRYFS